MNKYTLIFTKKEIEAKFQEQRYVFEYMPCSGKILFAALVFLGVVRRLSLLYDSYYGTKRYDYYRELELTIVFCIGMILEGLVSFVGFCKVLRGSMFIFTFNWHLIESSAFYYPDSFTLVPSTGVFILMTSGIGLFYTYNWIVSSIVFSLSGVATIVFLGIFYAFPIVDAVFYYGNIIAITCLSILLFYVNELMLRQLFYGKQKRKKNQIGFENLLQNIADGIIIQEKGKLVFFNKSVDSLLEDIDLEYSRKKQLGIPPRASLEEFSQQFATKAKEFVNEEKGITLEALLSDNKEDTNSEITQGEYEYKGEGKKNHKALYYNVTKSKVSFGDSSCTAYVFKNQTVLAELEEKKQSEMYQKSLIASVTHDLRTPLNGIMGIAENISSGAEEKIRVQGGLIKNTGTMMLYLINDVLDFSQIEAKRIVLHNEPIILRKLIDEIVCLVQFNYKQKKIELALEAKPNLPEYVTIDGNRYKQILFNLLGNALKFTLKGKVTISLLYDNPTDMLITKIKDTGIGIRSEDLDLLFHLYGRVKSAEKINHSGVGLGLHICKLLSELMGGSIFVDSKFGIGSIFTFYIAGNLCESHLSKIKISRDYIEELFSNFQGEESKEVIDRSSNIHISLPENNDLSSHRLLIETSNNKISCSCAKILIVDDDEMNTFVCRSFVAALNIVADVARNGQEAIDAAKKKARSKCCDYYNIIFMDFNMPIMDGIEATEKLRALMKDNEIPLSKIVGFSASTVDEERSIFLKKKGFDQILTKPITKEKFLGFVQQLTVSSPR